MSCTRCGGLMVVEASCDLMQEESWKSTNPIRCVNCGNVEDAIIRANRDTSRLPRLASVAWPRARRARGVRLVRSLWVQRAGSADDLAATRPRDHASRPSVQAAAFEYAQGEQCDSVVRTYGR
jgi:hypothetical protein